MYRKTHAQVSYKERKENLYPSSFHIYIYIFIRFLHVTETGYCADHYPVHALSWIPLPPLNKRVGCILRENRIDNTHIRVYIFGRGGDIRQSSFVPRTRSMIGHSTSIIYRPAIHIIPARVFLDPRFFFHPGGRPSLP